MLRLGLGAAIVGMQACASAPEPGAFHVEPEMLHAPRDGMQGELEWAARVEIGPGIVAPALIEVTSKGNGHLSAFGQSFRVYDSHDDGAVFDPPFLHVTFVDLDADGFRDLVLLGAKRNTDDDALVPYLRVFIDLCAVKGIWPGSPIERG